MQIKTTMGYHYTPSRMTKIQNTDNTNCWQKRGGTGILSHFWQECKMIRPLWKTIWWFLTKLNMLLTIWSGDHTPCYLLKGDEKLCPHKTCTCMFTTALFIITEMWKQPRCPSVGEWINNKYMYTYSWFTSLYSRNYHNIVKQLYTNYNK